MSAAAHNANVCANMHQPEALRVIERGCAEQLDNIAAHVA
jgi:hypothetical protein